MDVDESVEKALDKARDDEGVTVPDLAETSWSMRLADAGSRGTTGPIGAS